MRISDWSSDVCSSDLGKGIKPKEQREELGDYRIAAFDAPLESVDAYLLNINTNDAYAGLRERRATTREKNAPVSGWELAETLTSYSERGRAYVDSLHAILRSEEHTSELLYLMRILDVVLC